MHMGRVLQRLPQLLQSPFNVYLSQTEDLHLHVMALGLLKQHLDLLAVLLQANSVGSLEAQPIQPWAFQTEIPADNDVKGVGVEAVELVWEGEAG